MVFSSHQSSAQPDQLVAISIRRIPDHPITSQSDRLDRRVQRSSLTPCKSERSQRVTAPCKIGRKSGSLSDAIQHSDTSTARIHIIRHIHQARDCDNLLGRYGVEMAIGVSHPGAHHRLFAGHECIETTVEMHQQARHLPFFGVLAEHVFSCNQAEGGLVPSTLASVV